MIQKINAWGIVKAHISTFVSFRSKKPAVADFVLFLFVPLGVSAALVASGARVENSARAIIATGLSIFAGLLFNLLLLVADIAVRGEDASRGQRRSRVRIKLSVLQELHSNIAFAILLSLLDLFAIVALSIEGTLPGRFLLEGIMFFLSLVFFLTLLMILKRAHALIAEEVQEANRLAS